MRWKLIIPILLAATAVTVFIAPEAALSPGHLATAHAEASTSCFDCHAVLGGVPDERCRSCHGIEAFETGALAAFHARPEMGACIGCHTDHAGYDAVLSEDFDHSALPKSFGDDCMGCHTAPGDDLHASDLQCTSCHGTDAWAPASFDHEIPGYSCADCHHAPDDDLHTSAGKDCASCHTADAWTPASFEHDEFFRFDRHHPAQCSDCHPPGDLSTYTCYDCHEHSARNIAGEHREEGIRDFEDCVACHRSGDEDEAKRRWRNSEGGRERDDDEHDDDHDDDDHERREHGRDHDD